MRLFGMMPKIRLRCSEIFEGSLLTERWRRTPCRGEENKDAMMPFVIISSCCTDHASRRPDTVCEPHRGRPLRARFVRVSLDGKQRLLTPLCRVPIQGMLKPSRGCRSFEVAGQNLTIGC